MPAAKGLQSFLIHSEHLFLSENTDICGHYTFSEQIKHVQKTEAITGHQFCRFLPSIPKFKTKQIPEWPNQIKEMVKYLGKKKSL